MLLAREARCLLRADRSRRDLERDIVRQPIHRLRQRHFLAYEFAPLFLPIGQPQRDPHANVRRAAGHRELPFDEQRHQPIFDGVASHCQLLADRPSFVDLDHGNSRSLTDRSAEQCGVTSLQVIELARQILRQQRRDRDEFANSTGKLSACFDSDLFAELSQLVGRGDLAGRRPRHELGSQPRPLPAFADDHFQKARLLDLHN